jgi:hypothetical protein
MASIFFRFRPSQSSHIVNVNLFDARRGSLRQWFGRTVSSRERLIQIRQ